MEDLNDTQRRGGFCDGITSGQSVRGFLRFFAVVRVLITIVATGYILSPLYLDAKTANDELLFFFHKELAVAAINIFITSLLWTGAFAETRSCLPVYTMTEVPFLLYAFVRMVLFIQIEGFMLIAITVHYLIFCIFIIPLMVLRFYSFLSDRDIARAKFVYGRVDDEFD
ncbi:hypothetical protein PENTCL1PPCAC_6100 [Pristionchus entomophagus]|uniref:G protein-coupled receptor n=1 Tax=Pristionchus entomophagus TaxID=358040 RepID=A0AAV5SV34_9BILA|nr:hypothetical protein PENTCL1PPCAC_6100 [Pristionchus entomophagus]